MVGVVFGTFRKTLYIVYSQLNLTYVVSPVYTKGVKGTSVPPVQNIKCKITYERSDRDATSTI